MDCTLNITAAAPVLVALPIEAAIGEGIKDDSLIPTEEVQLFEPYQHIEPQQTLETIMATEVNLDSDARIQSLEQIIVRLSSLGYESSKLGLSPGFDTINSQLPWRAISDQYETLDAVNATRGIIPMPSPESAIECFHLVKKAWEERLRWEASDDNVREGFCSCIKQWRQGQNVSKQLCNQVIEQLMCREASACLRSQPAITHVWNECYSPDKCPSPETMSCLYLDSSISLLTYETYLNEYIKSALEAKSTIDICICYLFYDDPVARYILLDLLPYVAAKNDVKVRVVFELAILESQCLQQPFDKTNTQSQGHLVKKLPEGSPPYVNADKKFRSAVEVVQEFLNISSTTSIETRYWFARDKACGYRIKNHAKCHIFDGNAKNGKVIAGGSNVAPKPGSLDTDFVIQGEISNIYLQDFDRMWTAMTPVDGSFDGSSVAEEKKECEDVVPTFDGDHGVNAMVDNGFSGHKSKILFLPSKPGSSGADVILRCVLGAINNARESIQICMGHFNVSLVVAKALKAATDRGVKVSIISNSMYSCDLRTGQRDLFLSLQQMLTVAPAVELFVTADKDGKKPPFLHSKYVVVDSEWSATGSWNMWTRSAFYEMEAEVFVQSENFAAELVNKFERESAAYCIPVKTVDECLQFMPKGCPICEGFGPFYDA